jgi:curved DNA-binding protein CbpA
MADYYAILGVSRTASAAEIRQAYARLARDKHPDRFADPAQREQAHEVFRDLTTAFNALSNEKSRREYDWSLERPRATGPEEIAREAHERALQHMGANQFHEAVELLRSAVHHAPDNGRYHATLASALARNPHWVRDAIQEAEKAAQLEPKVAGHHVLVAALLLSQGLKLRARRAAEAALRLSPDDAAARRVLEEAGS